MNTTNFNIEASSAYLGLTCVDPSASSPGDYSFMLNGCGYDGKEKTPFIRMYKGNRFADKLPLGQLYVGHVTIVEREVCLFSVNPNTGYSEIGIFDGQKYTTTIGSPDLGFRIDRPIQAVVDKDFNGGKTVIWVQRDAAIRYMNLNNPPLLNNVLDVDALNIFRKYSYPKLKVNEIVNGGRILAGAYYICLQYADENGNGLTSCSTPVGPINIYRDTLNQTKSFINGSPDREPTNKAIRVALSNIDQSFKYLNVLVIKSFQGIRSAVLAATIPTFQQSYLYTGNPDIEQDRTLDEVLIPGVSYSSAKTIALTEGTVLLGNLKGRKEYNLQPLISKVGVQWQVIKEKYDTAQNSYANPLKSLYELQYRRNEVYALGMVIRWNDGTKSRVYPFVGRKKDHTHKGDLITQNFDQYGGAIISGQWDSMPVIQDDDIFETGNIPERHQVFSTALQMGNDLPNPVTDLGPAMFGEMGYYESTDRFPNNPDVWGADAGQPIRLFRMPDHQLAPITDGQNSFRTDKDIVSIYKLGVRFPNIQDIIASFPKEVRDQMEGWEIVRADRRNNKSILASGIIHNMLIQNWADQNDANLPFQIPTGFNVNNQEDDVRLYPNYPHNDLHDDTYILKKSIAGDIITPFKGNDRYRKDVFTFVSPDTSFEKNLLFGGEMLIHNELYGVAKEDKFFVEPYPLLKDKGSDKDQVIYHSLSLAYYNNWKSVVHGLLRREVKEAMYVPFNSQVGSGVVGLPIHNLTRESTVMVYTGKEIKNTSTTDFSRASIGDPDFGCNLGLNKYRSTALYYVSLISRIANQYGSVFDMRWLFSNMDDTNVKNNQVVFGGDSYVAPFSIKRQLVYFQNAQAWVDVPDGQEGIDLKTSETISSTAYYYLSARRNANKDSRTECSSSGGLFGRSDMGLVPLIYTGIPIVFCESDYNIDLRINADQDYETYYPNLKDGGEKLRTWTGIRNIDKDNYYGLNASYSEQNDLFGYLNPDPFYDPKVSDATHYSSRAIYSLKGSPENHFNNLLVFLPLNYHDFGRDSGELNDIRDIGNYRVLFKFDHALYLHQLYSSIETDNRKLVIGSGDFFNTAPVRIAKTDNGYAGSSAQWVFNNTRFGAFFIDAERKSVFQYADSLQEISANAMSEFFSENLSLKLLEDIPFFKNFDNPSNPEGVGFCSTWDVQDKLWILTKIDYELIDKSIASHFTMNDFGQLLLNNRPISLKDNKVFANRSFTISYNPMTQKWNGWHSFLPAGYFGLKGKYYSMIGNEAWCHDNPIPRTYYGKKYPFVFEGVLKDEAMTNNLVHSLAFITRAFPINSTGLQQGESSFITFNKAILYNMHQSTGMMLLSFQDENDLSHIMDDEQIGATFTECFLRRRNSTWGFSKIGNYVKNKEKPFFTTEWSKLKTEYFIDKVPDHDNHDYTRDYKEFAQLEDLWTKYRLIYDRDEDVQLYLYLTTALTELVVK